jgi:MSHA pilin protein MshD
VDALLVTVLLSIVAVGVTTVSARLGAQSAQAVKMRQALALAQGLLEEVRHAPFTYCDRSQSPPATGAFAGGTGCQAPALVDQMGPEPGESRYNAAARFNGVTDYQGFTMPGPGCAGICELDGTLISGPGSALAGCSAGVTMAPQALAVVPPANSIPALDANGRPQVLRIAVTVACPGLDPLRLETVRVRHAPTSF